MIAEPCIPTKNRLHHSGVLSIRELWFNSSEIKLLPLGPDYRGWSPHAADKLQSFRVSLPSVGGSGIATQASLEFPGTEHQMLNFQYSLYYHARHFFLGVDNPPTLPFFFLNNCRKQGTWQRKMVPGKVDVERAPFHHITIDSIWTRPLIILLRKKKRVLDPWMKRRQGLLFADPNWDQ